MLRLALLDDFRESMTLLISGSRENLLEIASYLDAGNNILTIVPNSTMPEADGALLKLTLKSSPDDTKTGMRVDEEGGYVCMLDAAQAKKFSELTRAVALSDAACHAYLEGANDEVVVMVSKDEYGELGRPSCLRILPDETKGGKGRAQGEAGAV